ncbi:aminopeptidase N [Phycisphaerales bacterium]|nr:aminopeptidase N [Phycisphaerales bacterium]
MNHDDDAVRGYARAALILTALAGTAMAQVAAPPGEEMGHESCSCWKEQMLAWRFGQGLAIDEPGGPGYSDREAFTDTDVLSNDIDIEVVPGSASIFGSNTIRVRSLVDGLSQFTYMLRGNFTVQRNLSGNSGDNNRVTLNGSTVAVCTAPPGDNSSYARTVTLDRAYNAGEEFTVKIDYTGPAVSRGFGSIEFGTQNGQPVIASLSEPYYAATWVPVKDGDVLLPGNNADKAGFTLAVTAPDTLRTTCNGLLQSITPVAGSKAKYRWHTDYPTATYLGAFCTTAYNVWTRTYTYPLAGGGSGAMPVEFHIYPADDTPGNRTSWEKCLTMLAAYRPIYGEYPFVNEKYGIYEFPFGGGMEHQTNTGQGTFSESVTAHELAHQWWGDNVTCKTWNHIWLNEGFATYTEALWEERKPGSSGLPALFSAMAARRPTQVNDSVYVYATNSVNRIFSTNFTYRKGGWALHMLRHVIGDGAFFQTLADYRAAFEGSAAETDDFSGIASSVSGQDLTRFFQQWVYGIGAPAYAYGSQSVTINGQTYLRLSLRQTQDATWPGGGAPAGVFAMPVDIDVTTPQGTVTHVVSNDARTEHFVIPIAGSLTEVLVDPRNWILATDKVLEAYTPGPAKIVQAAPSPGASLTEAPAFLTVTFSENVSTQLSHYTLTGPGGVVPCAFAYAADNFTTTISPQSALAPGSYTLTVAQSVNSVASGQNLDGEMAANVLPSGDGVAGGAAALSFTIAPSCDPDVNCDGAVNGFDVQATEEAVNGDFSNFCQSSADLNGDGTENGFDIETEEQRVNGAPC